MTLPTDLATSLVTTIQTSFTNGLTWVAPILVAMVGINIVRRVINRGKNGRI